MGLVILLPEKLITNGRIATWLDAQHQYGVIARRQQRRTALHVVVALAAIVRTRPTSLLTPRLGAAVVGLVAPRDQDGRELVHR